MAPVVRYRYVDFGTVFTGDPRSRGADAGSESPGTLFANELATDVGGTCWGTNEPLAVIDHRTSATQFPSASAAVLHNANRIRERFPQSGFDVIWLVTHKEPDFDALCSMYLARWIIESPGTAINWESYGLHSDGWLDIDGPRKIDWFNLDLTKVRNEHHWPLLLASYASLLDTRRKIPCPRQRALHSILCAALKRGRDYVSQTSGATEFFDEVRSFLIAHQLNPIVESVLEGTTRFAPELAMLDREVEAYERDIRRARRSIVFLPEAEAPSARFFKTPKEVLLQEIQGKSQEVNAEDLLLKDTFRIPTDGIYLRDPECLLFQEWARLDLGNSVLGSGFEFTAIAQSEKRLHGAVNTTDYVFSITPDRANGRHLYTVWSRLQIREVEALRTGQQKQSPAPGSQPERATEAMDILLADPWTGGQGGAGTLVSTPSRGTAIGLPGERSDLRDDPVVEEVRTELENAIYAPESLVSGPQMSVFDLSASSQLDNKAPQQFDLNSPLQIPPPDENYLRYAAVRLRADVPVLPPASAPRGLAEQIAETLWHVLYPEQTGSMPAGFSEGCVYVTPDCVGVWGDRGIAIAQKAASAESKDRFVAMVSLVRDIARLRRDISAPAPAADTTVPTITNEDDDVLKLVVAQGRDLTLRAADIQHVLTLPGSEVFRGLSRVIGFDQLIGTLHELSQSAAENLRRRQEADQARRIQERSRRAAKLRSRLRWLQVFAIGLFVILIVDVVTWKQKSSSTAQRLLSGLAGPIALGLFALLLRPWNSKPELDKDIAGVSRAIVAGAIVATFLAWMAGLLHIWSK